MRKRKNNSAKRQPSSILPRSKKGRREIEIFGGLGVAVVSALVVSIFLGSSFDRYFITSTQYASVLATVLVDLTNGDRSQNSLRTLTLSPVLTAAAQGKANDMAAKSYFAHVSPEGIDPWHWFKDVGYTFAYAGENLAVDFSESGDVERAWMNSPTHRANILNPHFTEIGIAVAEGTYQGRRTVFVVQEFGTPAPSGVQGVVTAVSIPESPEETALATSAPAVLGEVKSKPIATAPPKKVVAQAPPTPTKVAVLGTSADVNAPKAPVKQALESASQNYASFWAHLLTSPRSMMQYLYWALAFLIIVALGVATEFEIRLHHTRKAVAAGVMLSFMLVMFLAANTFVFTSPTITPQATMAAAGAAWR